MNPDVPMSPQSALAALGLLFIAAFFLIGPIVAWVIYAARPFSTWKPISPIGFGAVGLVDIAVCFVLMFVLAMGVTRAWRSELGARYDAMRESMPSDVPAGDGSDASDSATLEPATSDAPDKAYDPLTPMVIGSIQFATVLAAFLTVLFVVVRTGCRFSNLGWRFGQLPSDLWFGLLVYLMFAPVIMGINILTGMATQTKYDHPVLELLRHAPLMAFVMAAIFAPLTEELMFRSLLVGWFESIHFATERWKAFLVGALVGQVQAQGSTVADSGAVGQQPPMSPEEEPICVATIVPPWWPAILSGTLFGAAHFSYGISWVPLILFGILLGRVYQLRRSILTTIAIHALHNATMIGAAWLATFLKA